MSARNAAGNPGAGHARIAIVGGGLSGLLAAQLLQQQGLSDWLLLEARSVLGGRILSVDAAGQAVDPGSPGPEGFDLGPSWFWPGLQPQMDRVVDELGLQRFAQHESGDMLIERSLAEPPLRMRGQYSSPTSMRIAGGTGALITALQRRLDPQRIHTRQTVRRLRRTGSQVELDSESAAGELTCWRADHVLLALPPRLAVQFDFAPPLPPRLAQHWDATATWMAPHAKYVAVYPKAFWRDKGLSGAARSQQGPMAEIHDLSMPEGHAALFGFLGVPARVRRDLGDERLRALCRAQLGRLFGGLAAAPMADTLKDWAADPLIATRQDQEASGHHAAAPPGSPGEGDWLGALTGIGSEWSAQFPGYLAGAADAAARGVHDVLALMAQQLRSR